MVTVVTMTMTETEGSMTPSTNKIDAFQLLDRTHADILQQVPKELLSVAESVSAETLPQLPAADDTHPSPFLPTEVLDLCEHWQQQQLRRKNFDALQNPNTTTGADCQTKNTRKRAAASDLEADVAKKLAAEVEAALEAEREPALTMTPGTTPGTPEPEHLATWPDRLGEEIEIDGVVSGNGEFEDYPIGPHDKEIESWSEEPWMQAWIARAKRDDDLAERDKSLLRWLYDEIGGASSVGGDDTAVGHTGGGDTHAKR
jgi:hypothetical protein